jgi:hypothetical protein
MAVAALGSVQVGVFVPRDDPIGASAADRLRRACGEPFAPVLQRAFGRLDGLDPGAFWVIRELRVQVSVPASEPDPLAQAWRIAEAVTDAVERVVRAGPGTNALRFTSRAHYAASLVQAVDAGAAGSWVYDRSGPLRQLRPVPALLSVASSLDVPLLDLIGVLAATPTWRRLLTSSSADEVRRLDAAVRAAADPDVPVPAALMEAARTARAAMMHLWRSSPSARRLALLAHLAFSFGVTPQVIAAVWRAEAGPLHATEREPAPVVRIPETITPRPESAPGTDGASAYAMPAVAAPPGDGRAFSAPGAVAFMLLADLDEMLPPASPLGRRAAAAARLRAEVLRAVLGAAVAAHDPALAVAAGVTRPAEPDDVEAARTALLAELAPWGRELSGDETLGWRHPADLDWFATAPPMLGVIANAVFRRFARHLVGFAHAPASYLAERVLPPGGVVVVDATGIWVDLPAPQLQVVLQLACLDSFDVEPRWLDATVTVTHEAGR